MIRTRLYKGPGVFDREMRIKFGAISFLVMAALVFLEHYGKKPMAVLRDVEISPVSKADIERFAKEAGFTDIQFYGDWDLSPLTEKSDNIVAIIK